MQPATPFLLCPHCGYDLAADEPVSTGSLAMDPARRSATWRDIPLRLTASEWDVLFALAKADGAFVDALAIAERCGFAERSENLLSVYLCRVRAKIMVIDPLAHPFERTRGRIRLANDNTRHTATAADAIARADRMGSR